MNIGLILFLSLLIQNNDTFIDLPQWQESTINEIHKLLGDSSINSTYLFNSNKLKLNILSSSKISARKKFINCVISSNDSINKNDKFIIVESENQGEMYSYIVDLFIGSNYSMKHCLYEFQDGKWTLNKMEYIKYDVSLFNTLNSFQLKSSQKDCGSLSLSIVITYRNNYEDGLKAKIFPSPSADEVAFVDSLTKFSK